MKSPVTIFSKYYYYITKKQPNLDYELKLLFYFFKKELTFTEILFPKAKILTFYIEM